MPSRLEVVGTEDVQSARKNQKPPDLQTASKYPDRIPGYFDCKGTVPANQRAGTDRLAESGYLLNDRRAGQASSGGWAAWNPADRECLLHMATHFDYTTTTTT